MALQVAQKPMKLFFETCNQSQYFLFMLPVGFILAFLLQSGTRHGWFRLFQDLAVLLFAGFAAVFTLLSGRDETLRLYHFLGLAAGGILYLSGADRCFKWFRRKIACISRKQGRYEEYL